ncbi:MAG: flagellar hook-length control protein FliK [Lachnospiraceae bacterium]|nr:flagellar hook-length control protein FliK [Lachnospiraceae bacterium]
MMGTSGITNLVNDLNLLNVDIPKNGESSNGEFAKTFENVSQNGEIEAIKSKSVNVADELKTSENSVKDNYLKETNGRKFEKNVENNKDSNAASKTDSENSNIKKTNIDNKEEQIDAATEVVSAIVNAYCEAFGLTVDDFKAFLEENDISVSDLLDPAKVQSIVMQLNGITDSVDILTDDGIFDSIRNLEFVTENNANALKEDLNLDLSEVKDLLDNAKAELEVASQREGVEIKSVTVNHQAVEVNTERTDEVFEQNEISPVEIKQSTKSDSDKKPFENESGFSGNNLSGDNQVHNNLQVNNEEVVSYSDRVSEIYDQIGEQIRNISSENIREIEIRLQPETLGTIHVRVSESQGVMKAELITDNENVKAVIESQLIQLKQDFDESGIKVNEVEVRVSTNEFNENAEQDSKQEENEAAARTNTQRRINLADGIDALDVEEYEDDEKIAVEMMAANGNSMDYRA